MQRKESTWASYFDEAPNCELYVVLAVLRFHRAPLGSETQKIAEDGTQTSPPCCQTQNALSKSATVLIFNHPIHNCWSRFGSLSGDAATRGEPRRRRWCFGPHRGSCYEDTARDRARPKRRSCQRRKELAPYSNGDRGRPKRRSWQAQTEIVPGPNGVRARSKRRSC